MGTGHGYDKNKNILNLINTLKQKLGWFKSWHGQKTPTQITEPLLNKLCYMWSRVKELSPRPQRLEKCIRILLCNPWFPIQYSLLTPSSLTEPIKPLSMESIELLLTDGLALRISLRQLSIRSKMAIWIAVMDGLSWRCNSTTSGWMNWYIIWMWPS